MLQTTRSERYSGNGLVAKRNSQNFSKFSEHGAGTCSCNCRAISKSFSDTLFEMTPNILDIKQKIRTMFKKCPKKNNTASRFIKIINLQYFVLSIYRFDSIPKMRS